MTARQRRARRLAELVFQIALLCALGPAAASCSAGEKISNQAAAVESGKPAGPLQAPPEQPDFPALTADQWVNLSQSYFQEGRFLESIAAAQTALYLKPDLAEAYNNIGASYSALHLWDPAIQAAQQALRLKPDFALARNNLAWAISRRQLGSR